MSNQYEKLHIDDAALSRILQTVENADLDAYRDRPEFFRKERPELAEVGEPGDEKTPAGSSGKPGYRKNMSRMLINAFSIAAAAALTLLIAVPLIRINSGNMHSSESANIQTSGEANIQTSGDTNTKASGDSKLQASGDTNTKASGDSKLQASGDTNTKASGDSKLQASGDTNTKASGDSKLQASGDSEIPTADEEPDQDNAASPAGEFAEANNADTAPESAPSISSDLVVSAFRDYYDETFTVELNEVTPETVSVTVRRAMENGPDKTLTVTVDLTTGETVTVDEAGSQIETGTVSEDGIYTVHP